MENNNLNCDTNIITEQKEKSVCLQEERVINKTLNDEFACGFPEWSLVPPLQPIKRVRRSL